MVDAALPARHRGERPARHASRPPPTAAQALEGADYVINCVRIGGLEAFQTDIDIPLKYGVDQCVGDTLCAGGIMYGQRNIPRILDFCKDIREVADAGRACSSTTPTPTP